MHTPPLVSKDGVFSPQLQYAIEFYVDTRDQERAAMLAHMKPGDFIRAMRRSDVKAEIQRKFDLEDTANALLRAAARKLTQDKLDAALDKVIESKETSAGVKVRAIEVGYKRYGMLKEKHEHTGEGGAPLAFELVRIGAKKEPNDSE